MRDAGDVACGGENEEYKMDGQQQNEEIKCKLKKDVKSKAKKASWTTILLQDGTKVVKSLKQQSLQDLSLFLKTMKETIALAANQSFLD